MMLHGVAPLLILREGGLLVAVASRLWGRGMSEGPTRFVVGQVQLLPPATMKPWQSP